MKSSALALLTAAALTFAASSAAFAQDAMTPAAPTPTPEECLALQGAGATPPDESLVADDENEEQGQTATGTESSASDATGAIDDQTPEGCPDLTEADDE